MYKDESFDLAQRPNISTLQYSLDDSELPQIEDILQLDDLTEKQLEYCISYFKLNGYSQLIMMMLSDIIDFHILHLLSIFSNLYVDYDMLLIIPFLMVFQHSNEDAFILLVNIIKTFPDNFSITIDLLNISFRLFFTRHDYILIEMFFSKFIEFNLIFEYENNVFLYFDSGEDINQTWYLKTIELLISYYNDTECELPQNIERIIFSIYELILIIDEIQVDFYIYIIIMHTLDRYFRLFNLQLYMSKHVFNKNSYKLLSCYHQYISIDNFNLSDIYRITILQNHNDYNSKIEAAKFLIIFLKRYPIDLIVEFFSKNPDICYQIIEFLHDIDQISFQPLYNYLKETCKLHEIIDI